MNLLKLKNLISYIDFPQSHDVITIYDGPDSIYNQTGKLAPRNIRSSTSNMKIYFTSGDEGEDNKKQPNNGFEIAVDYILSGNSGMKVYI